MMRRKNQHDFGLRISDCGFLFLNPQSPIRNAPAHSSFAIRHSSFPHPSSLQPPASGLTLIELLVAIVIMVTVLGAVIPLLSPNNDARKIREAARELNSLLSQAQAQAARNGRPVGVALREYGTPPTTPGGTSNLSGMALEAYLISEPQSFTGFSSESQVRFLYVNGQVQSAQFVLAGSYVPGKTPATSPDDCYYADDLPPKAIRFGDEIYAGGFTYSIVDLDRDGDGNPDDQSAPPFKFGDYYINTGSARPLTAIYKCQLKGNDLLTPRAIYPSPTLAPGPPAPPWNGWTNPQPYKIRRQPAPGSDQPLQFPRGIGVDLQASGAHSTPPVPTAPGTPRPDIFDADVAYLASLSNMSGAQPQIADTIGIMFGPNGALQEIYFNNLRIGNAEQVVLNVGRYELGNGFQRPEDYDFMNNPVTPAEDMDVFRQRRDRLNWLNPDSMWVTVNRAGRVITSENHAFNPTNDSQFGPVVVDSSGQNPFYNDFQSLSGGALLLKEFTTQREYAHEYADAMSSTGGRGR